MIGRREEFRDAMAAITRDGGVVLRGASGVGKSVLLDTVAQRCRRQGWRVTEIRASETTRALPLWAMFPLLPDVLPPDRGQLAEVLWATAPDPDDRVLVAVDDIQCLDHESVILLAELLADERWRLAASLRTGTEAPERLEAMWRAAGVVEIDVEPFGRDDSEAFIAAVLDGAVAGDLVDSVLSVSSGNALLTRELLLDAMEGATVAVVDDEWVALDHPIDAVAGDRTRRCIERRLGRLRDDDARLLQLVAIAADLDEGYVSKSMRSGIDRLGRVQLIGRSKTGSGRACLRANHPLIARVVLDGLSQASRWARTQELIEMARAADGPRADSSVQIARWAEDCGFDLDVDEWVSAARTSLATFDIDSAERWARAAIAADREHHGAHRCLGEVLRLRGDAPAAASALAEAAMWAVTHDDVVATALSRAAVLGFQLGQPGEALQILRTTADQVDDPLTALSLRSEAAVMGTLLGRFEDVLLSQPDADLLADADDRTRWLLGQNEVYARAMLGRVAAVPDLVAALRPHYGSVARERPHELDLLLGSLAASRLQQGEFRLGIDEVEAEMASFPAAGSFWGISRAVLSLLMQVVGDPRAVDAARGGVVEHERMDPFGSMPIALAALALADGTDDVTALEKQRGRLAGSEPWTSIWIGRAQARAAYRSGDSDDAVRRSVTAGELAMETNHFAYAAVTLHDAVIYGAADVVAPLLESIVKQTRGASFLELLADHASSGSNGDADGLERCARAFVDRGALALGAYAFARAAAFFEADGETMAARRLDIRSRCLTVVGGVPSLHKDLVEIDGRLSDRELETVALAARRFSSKEMATRLFLSVRTVDNHLSAAYRKLGVGGRDEVADLLGSLVEGFIVAE